MRRELEARLRRRGRGQTGARHLAESASWLAWRKDGLLRLAAQLAIAWSARLRVAGQRQA